MIPRSNSPQRSKRMKKILALAALLALGAAPAAAQTIPLYEHFGTGVYRVDRAQQAPPAIDATAFANYGTFVITNVIDYDLYPLYAILELPYEFGNLVNFTNRNRMSGLFGFRFNQATDVGVGRMGTFVNDNGALIDSIGGVIGENAVSPTVGFYTNILFLANSYLMVDATNIVNRGTLRTDNRGIIQLDGDFVDLTRGAIVVRPSQNIYDDYLFGCYDGGTKSWFGTNYWPDIGVSDYYWCRDGYEAYDRFVPANVYFPYLGGFACVTAPHDVRGLQPPYFTELNWQWFITNNVTAFMYTNDISRAGTNIIYSAIFVSNIDTNIFVSGAFGPSSIPTNPWPNPCIEFAALQNNPITGGVLTNRLYFMDYLMGETNNALQYNVQSLNVPTYCPGNYVVSRTAPCEFLFGAGPNTLADPDLFYNDTYSNFVVTNYQTGYAFRITNVAVQVPANVSITNLGSRVDIRANTLKMDRTRLSSEGYVSIKANHLLSSTNASLEVEYLDLNIGSTNGNLMLQSLVKDSVDRFAGNVRAYSSSWTNFTGQLLTNTIVDPETGEETNEITTNLVTLSFHVFIVDSRLSTRYPVNILNLKTTGTNTLIGDGLLVSDSLQMDAERLTIAADGYLTIRNPINNWATTNFPNLRYLTNLGTIVVTNVVDFGSDVLRPYAAVVNRGSILAASERIMADYFENSGLISSVQVATNAFGSSTNFGPMRLEVRDAKLDGGQLDCGLDLYLAAQDLKMRGLYALVRGTGYLSITNTFSDTGAGSGNELVVNNGFHLLRRPAGGDLFGTSLRTVAAPFAYVVHTWNAADHGATPEGFANNAAVGRLILDGGGESYFNFAGGEPNSALYVDYLEFRGSAQEVESALNIEPNLTIYFADSNVGAETLDGKLGGRLRWVKEFAGPNSSVDVVLAGGKTTKMNRAYRNSAAYDTDGDGLANAFDPEPLTSSAPVTLGAITFTNVPPLQPLLTWDAAPLTVTVLESSPALPASSWQVLHRFTNDTVNSTPVQFVDPNPMGPTRYYRLRQSQ